MEEEPVTQHRRNTPVLTLTPRDLHNSLLDSNSTFSSLMSGFCSMSFASCQVYEYVFKGGRRGRRQKGGGGVVNARAGPRRQRVCRVSRNTKGCVWPWKGGWGGGQKAKHRHLWVEALARVAPCGIEVHDH